MRAVCFASLAEREEKARRRRQDQHASTTRREESDENSRAPEPMPFRPRFALAVLRAVLRLPTPPTLSELPRKRLPLSAGHVRALPDPSSRLVLPARVPHDDARPVNDLLGKLRDRRIRRRGSEGKALDEREDVGGGGESWSHGKWRITRPDVEVEVGVEGLARTVEGLTNVRILREVSEELEGEEDVVVAVGRLARGHNVPLERKISERSLSRLSGGESDDGWRCGHEGVGREEPAWNPDRRRCWLRKLSSGFSSWGRSNSNPRRPHRSKREEALSRRRVRSCPRRHSSWSSRRCSHLQIDVALELVKMGVNLGCAVLPLDDPNLDPHRRRSVVLLTGRSLFVSLFTSGFSLNRFVILTSRCPALVTAEIPVSTVSTSSSSEMRRRPTEEGSASLSRVRARRRSSRRRNVAGSR